VRLPVTAFVADGHGACVAERTISAVRYFQGGDRLMAAAVQIRSLCGARRSACMLEMPTSALACSALMAWWWVVAGVACCSPGPG
jgi:hypothetical protein